MTGIGQTNRNTVYNILGNTDRLSEVQMSNLIRGRRQVVEFARLHPDNVFINGPANEKKVSITFDDGPDPYIMPKILEILKYYNIKAGFFCIGNQAAYFPDIIREAYKGGHLILNHSWNHPYLTKLSPADIKYQIVSTERKIESIIGSTPAILRPPYGAINERVLGILKETNNKAVIWSIDSMDWVPHMTKNEIIQNVLDNIRPGDIIIMHSSSGHLPNASTLPEIITGLAGKNYTISDLASLLRINAYK